MLDNIVLTQVKDNKSPGLTLALLQFWEMTSILFHTPTVLLPSAVMADTRLPSLFQMSASLFTEVGVSLSEQGDSNRSGCDPRFPNLLVQHSLSHQCRPHWPRAGLQGRQRQPFSGPNQRASLVTCHPAGLHTENTCGL